MGLPALNPNSSVGANDRDRGVLDVRHPSPAAGAASSAGAVRPGTSMEDLKSMAETVARSGLFPGLQTPSAVFTLMLICESEGLHPAQALKRYHIIENRPTMRADAMQADFMQRGGLVRWERSDTEVCSAWFIHPRYAPDPGFNVTVTLAELFESGVAARFDKNRGPKGEMVLKDNYKRHPRQMLRARAISEGVRAVCPAVVAGIYAPEEVDDFRDAPMVNVTAGGTIHSVPSGEMSQLEGAAILPAPSDPGFAAKVAQAKTLTGVVREQANGGHGNGQTNDQSNGPVNYEVPVDPITAEQRGRLRDLVQGTLKLSKEAWEAILLEFGVGKTAELSAVDAETIIRRLEARADREDPFGSAAGPGTYNAGNVSNGNGGGASQQEAERREPAVAPGTPRDDDPRVPLINEALAIVGRLGWDAQELTRNLSALDRSVVGDTNDIMELNEQGLVYLIRYLKVVETEGSPGDDLVVPDATRPLTKANARAQARAAKQTKPAPEHESLPEPATEPAQG